MTTPDGVLLLRCEKIVNESWSKAKIYHAELKAIMKKGKAETEKEIEILMIFANIADQKMTFDEAADKKFFDIDGEMSPCGKHPKKDCPCGQDCDLIK